MNKKALSEYALFARKELENQIKLSLNRLGIFSDSIKAANIVGDFTIVEGTQETFPKRVYSLRNSIIENHIKEKGFNSVVEEFAYTWFNRIVAIRFLEVHDYLPHGFRVLTSRDGSFEPEILQNLPYVKDELNLDLSVVESLKRQNKTEELYRYVLFKQCNALSPTLPMLFDEQESYLELLLPTNLLSEGSVIRKITDIPEDDFKNDVEVIGWLYQFYNSVKKEEVFASEETITKDTLPAVTQLFTPDWIVRYMAQNSIGRIWMESYPNSPLKSKMNYYIPENAQSEEIQRQIDSIKYKNVEPSAIKIIEPCCGSGHILVYAFDLLYQAYLERGYSSKDIPTEILKNNLFGLDIDKRAVQLSQFALIMKARSIDNRFFSKDRLVVPNIYEIADSSPLIRMNYRSEISALGFSSDSQKTIEYIVDKFREGKTIGSLLKLDKKDYQAVIRETETIKNTYIPDILETPFFETCLPLIRLLCEDSLVMTEKYDVMITNPPYLPVNSLIQEAQDYIESEYPEGKADLFSAFMLTNFVKKNGFLAMINMQTWLFANHFSKIRQKLLSTRSFVSLIQLGPHAFETIGGEVVQTVSFIQRFFSFPHFVGLYCDLSSLESQSKKEEFFLSGSNRYLADQANFLHTPDFSFLFKLEDKELQQFGGENVGKYANPRIGLVTGDVDRFLRFWFEVDNHKIGFGLSSDKAAEASKKKWFPYQKGGEFRKYYGNNIYVVNFENNGYEMIHDNSTEEGRVKSHNYNGNFAFKEGITWTKITTSQFCCRYVPGGYMFDDAGPLATVKDPYLFYTLGFLNSTVGKSYMDTLCPTINKLPGKISQIPFIVSGDKKQSIDEAVSTCISIAKADWDDNEKSWDFSIDPCAQIIQRSSGTISLENAFHQVEKETIERHDAYQKNQEFINRMFSDIYQLEESEYAPEPTGQNTISIATKEKSIKSLLSYLVGVLLGRYSMKREKVAYAGGEFDTFSDEQFVQIDGIVPISRFESMSDCLSVRLCNLIKVEFGEAHYLENMEFIANSLGRESDESFEACLNRYLNDGFYSDHLARFEKRPIYWMLSSGKWGAFKCLVYIHRYNKETLARINSRYFLKNTDFYKAERLRLENKIALAGADLKEKKNLETKLREIQDCEQELLEYGQILDHVANLYVNIDLDDGIRDNYKKFQGQQLIVDGATITKDLLFPIKGLEGEKNEH